MKLERNGANVRSLTAILCIILLADDTLAYPPPQASTTASPSAGQAAKIPPEQLDSLVAPIALYPDPLLAQVLAASTYPLQIVMLQRWLEKNPNLKDKALADTVAKQPWDPSIQALAGLPEVVKRLGDDIQWTVDLGNAFLAQQSDVMDAVQRMRKKAQDKGTLKPTEQQKVETKVVENKSVIVIEQANPQVVYVPSYNPVVVYGPAYYPYPPIYYPSWGYVATTAAISFGVGVAMGAFWSGGWGWGCGWGGNDIDINVNNNFNRNSNINRGDTNRGNIGSGDRSNLGSGNRTSTQPAGAGNKWQHNPSNRGGTPYRDRATADRFGGSARGDSLAQRQSGAQQQIGQQGGNLASNRDRASAGDRSRGSGISDRSSGSGIGNRSSGSDRIGSRDLSRSGGGNRDAFGGGSRGYSGSSARSSSSRGSSSMSGGGGFSRGGGGGGGGFSRGGGGGRRR
jgi:Protein of unknown function (DUF3300)